MPIVTFERFEVVVVPFPFTDSTAARRRPTLVLSDGKAFNTPAGHSVMAMITTARNSTWPLDVPIGDIASAGLPAPSIVRLKLFTLDHRFVLRRAGKLAVADARAVAAALRKLWG